MKTNQQKHDRICAEGKAGKKRMWITREQIGIAKREQDMMRRYWKENGAEKPPTHVSFAAGGAVADGEWVYGEAKYNGLSTEEAEKTLRNRKKKVRL